MSFSKKTLEWAEKAMKARSSKERDRLFAEGPPSKRPEARRSALLKHAIDYKDLPLLRQMLAEGADPNAVVMGETPLGWAILRGHVQITEELLKAGADPNRPSSGYPPIYGAVTSRSVKILAALIKAGADVNRTHRTDASALAHACLEGHAPVVKALLAAGANVNQPGKIEGMRGDAARMTPLMIAAMCGHAPVVKLLLAAGADTAAKDAKGHTALDWAKAKKSPGHLQAAALLTAAGAQPAHSAEDPDALEPDFCAAAKQPQFLAAVKKLKALTRQPPQPMENIQGPIPGPVAFSVPDEARAKKIVADLQEQLLQQGAYLLHTRDMTDEGGDAVALFPTTNIYEVLAALQTEGPNSEVYNRDLIHWLRALEVPLRITGAGHDFLFGRFTAPIPDPAALMRSIARICPDAGEDPASLRAQAKRLADTRELFLWWD